MNSFTSLSVAINLNPYQGLKHRGQLVDVSKVVQVAINLNPYQGLKLIKDKERCYNIIVAINLNPYQGLKQDTAQVGIDTFKL